MNFYDRLQQATEEERRTLHSAPIIVECLKGNVSLESYTAFLTQAYHHVKHTVPLLMACGGRLPQDMEWLREAVGEYIREETGHQEWILDDLEACGANRDAIRRGQPHITTELMIAYAYDTVHRRNPVGFFGMVNVLEGTSVELASRAADIFQRQLGLPDNAFHYLRSHGALDLEHIEFYKGLMNRLDSDNDREAVVHSCKVIYKLYGDIFRSLPSPAAVQ